LDPLDLLQELLRLVDSSAITDEHGGFRLARCAVSMFDRSGKGERIGRQTMLTAQLGGQLAGLRLGIRSAEAQRQHHERSGRR
jgi:hypothetical protein